MRCDKCGMPTETRYNKMPLCGGCKEKVKAYRLLHQDSRQADAAKVGAKGK